jgi:hypothetical protein
MDGRSSRLLQQFGLLGELQRLALDGRWTSYVLVSPEGAAKEVPNRAKSEEQEVGRLAACHCVCRHSSGWRLFMVGAGPRHCL